MYVKCDICAYMAVYVKCDICAAYMAVYVLVLWNNQYAQVGHYYIDCYSSYKSCWLRRTLRNYNCLLYMYINLFWFFSFWASCVITCGMCLRITFMNMLTFAVPE